MTKTYRLFNAGTLRTNFTVDGKVICIRFSGGALSSSGVVIRHSTFSTPCEKLQQSIERDASYGSRFILEESQEPELLAEIDKTDFEMVGGITSTQLAIEWLTTNKSYEIKGRPTKDDIKAVALFHKVEFTDWK